MKRNKGQSEAKITIIGFLVVIFVVLFLTLVFGTFYTIGAGERGILLTWGEMNPNPQLPGLHFKIPIAQSVAKMNVQTQKYEAELTAASSDLQDVKTKIVINYHIVPESAPEIYKTIGVNYADVVIYPLEQEANKATTAKFTAAELITKRDSVREEMKTILSERLRGRGIIVEEISIVDFKFSESFTQAIELKVTAEQNAFAAKNKLAQIEFEAQQRVAQAKGEAEAIQIQAVAIQAKGGPEYIQLQAIHQWDGKLPIITSGNAFPFINLPMTSSNPIVVTNSTQ